MPSSLKTRRPRIAEVPQLLMVDDLSGGLELRQSPSLLKPSQARLSASGARASAASAFERAVFFV